jgi:hypothetical protein
VFPTAPEYQTGSGMNRERIVEKLSPLQLCKFIFEFTGGDRHPATSLILTLGAFLLLGFVVWRAGLVQYQRDKSNPAPITETQMADGEHLSDSSTASIERAEVKTKAGREEVVKQLSSFIEQGRVLESELSDPALLNSVADTRVSKWNYNVSKFIDEHMGTRFSDRFKSDKDLPIESPLATPNSEVKKQLWQALHHRILRLDQFVSSMNHWK